MRTLSDLIADFRAVPPHRQWPRVTVDAQTWGEAAAALAEGRWTLLGLWGEAAAVHLALHEPSSASFGIISLSCPDGEFPSIGVHYPAAIRLERAAHDLFGLRATGLPDERPWLDHGAWILC